MNDPDYYCAYTHSLDGQVFYVGSGWSCRPRDLHSRTKWWKDYVGKRKDEIVITIYGRYKDKYKATKREGKLIDKLKPYCNRKHPITNKPLSWPITGILLEHAEHTKIVKYQRIK